jgi:small subunit ribosomal protein S9
VALIQYYGTGRRKTSTARVFVRPGSGKFTVNGKAMPEFLPVFRLQAIAKAPLVTTETGDKTDILVRVTGGGITGQAGAIRLGIARALIEMNPEFRKKLKDAGYLTRDSREVERKKYGQRKARARFQFSKR